jgi:very-short-patch-repair endonuclease
VEKRLWWALRDQFPEYGFRRQHPVGPHIVDSACPRLKLAVELDGGQHAEREEADRDRTLELARRGYGVVRFWNGDIISNLPGVLQAIARELESRTPPATES